MKSLQTIQKLSKIGKVVSEVIYIMSIVGFFLCLVGVVSLALGVDTIKIGSFTLEGWIQKEANITNETIYLALIIAMIFCISRAILSKYWQHYFKGELQDGTPFNEARAIELRRIGILTICISLVTQIVAEIIYQTLSSIWNCNYTLNMDNVGSVILGIMCIVMSLIFRYGAEVTSSLHSK